MSSSEILIILLAVLLLFGGKRLPEIARSVGRVVIQYRRAMAQLKRESGLDELERLSLIHI